MEEKYYLIKKSDLVARVDRLEFSAKNVVNLSKDNILTLAEAHIEKQSVENNIDSFFDGYVAALQDLKNNR